MYSSLQISVQLLAVHWPLSSHDKSLIFHILLNNFFTFIQQSEVKGSSNVSSVTIPIQLLDQIRFQREKLESSLYHNDLIRHQLEGIMSSLSSQGDDNMVSLWQKMKDTAEQLTEAQRQNQELEIQLQEVREQLEDRKEKARLASAANEQLEVGLQDSLEFLIFCDTQVGGNCLFNYIAIC